MCDLNKIILNEDYPGIASLMLNQFFRAKNYEDREVWIEKVYKTLIMPEKLTFM